MKETLILISVALGVTLIAFGFLVRYYRNEIQRLVDYSETLQNGWNNATKGWNETVDFVSELASELRSKSNKILELINSMNILKNQNLRYSKICRRLYDENQNLKVEIQGVESLFQDMKNKANEFELKVIELENKKKRKKG